SGQLKAAMETKAFYWGNLQKNQNNQ
ncbi:hypothetical protein lerEdw1_016088, partial [Lerista edwardsae]